MRSSSKEINKNTANSQIKTKINYKISQNKLDKQTLHKTQSCLKLVIKTHQPIHPNKTYAKNQSDNNINNKSKRVSKIDTEPNYVPVKIKDKQIVGWSQIDKIKYQLVIQKRLRQSLQKQNQTLKKEVAFLNNFGASLRTSAIAKKTTTEQSFLSNKQKIINRLNKKRQGVTGLEKDNESTGLYSAKTNRFEQKINQIYEDYAKKRILPTFEGLYQIAKNYFNQYKQNYSKLYILFKNCKNQQKIQLFSQVQDLLFLFQVPILYKQRPRQLLRSVSKQSILKSKQSSLDNSLAKIKISSKQINKQKYRQQSKQSLGDNKEKYYQNILQQLTQLLNILLKNNKLFCRFLKTAIYDKMLKKIKQKNN